MDREGNMGKNATDRGAASGEVSRRAFLSTGAAGVALAAGRTREANAQSGSQRNWDRSAEVVVIGAGVAGLPAAITARDHGASVIVVDENYDIGGRGILSGGGRDPPRRPAPAATGRNQGPGQPGVAPWPAPAPRPA